MFCYFILLMLDIVLMTVSGFRDMVKPGAKWDFKRSQSFKTGNCPSSHCPKTVTICGICFNYDVPGNIHFGFIGRVLGIRRWLLHYGAGTEQEGDIVGDDPVDTVAINIGADMDDKGTTLCAEIRKNKHKLNKGGTNGCNPCPQKYRSQY